MSWRGNAEHEGSLPPFPQEADRGVCDLKEYLSFSWGKYKKNMFIEKVAGKGDFADERLF